MKSFLKSLAVGVMAAGLTSCAAAEKAPPKAAAAAPTSSHFEATGKVTLHTGMPCTSQIMFDFRPAHSKIPIWLAARMKESKVLTDAAKHRRTVRVSGVWQHGKERTCRYINITGVTVQKGLFSW
jgi:predicted acyl esterase